MIRATQYLPSVLRLQQYLLRKHHHRSSHEQLENKKIKDVISEAENGTTTVTVNLHNEYNNYSVYKYFFRLAYGS